MVSNDLPATVKFTWSLFRPWMVNYLTYQSPFLRIDHHVILDKLRWVPATWNSPAPVVAAGLAAVGSDLVAVSRTSGHIRLFFVDAASALQNIYWGLSP